jgi:hypothetical protein
MSDFPDFIIAGAAKCGTTSLSRYLDAHPEIYMPSRELNFYPFSNAQHGYKVFNHPFITRLDDYKKYYANVTAPVKGEKSVSYFYPSFAEAAINNMLRIHPDPDRLKLIILLRNPVDRAFSQYIHNREFHETLAFEEAAKAWANREKEGWIPAYDYLGAGLYAGPMKAYMDHFPHNRVWLFEDLKANPEKVLNDLYAFLGVNQAPTGNYHLRYNVSKIPRNRPVHYLYQGLVAYNPVKYLLKYLMAGDRYQALKLKLISYTHYKPELSGDTRRRLVNYYKEDIRELQELINRDLGRWMEP